MPEFKTFPKCLKWVSDAFLKMTLKTVRQTVRHLSDTCAIKPIKTAACGCLTECLTLSDSFKIPTVCLAACPLDAPRQTPRQNRPDRSSYHG